MRFKFLQALIQNFRFKTKRFVNYLVTMYSPCVAFIIFSVLVLGLRTEGALHLNKVQIEKDDSFLSGTWYSQLGSKMTLNHSKDGTLFGTFKTAVERHVGTSGGVQMLHGHVGLDYPTTLGFTVTFNGGDSTASWSGQYQVCDGQEALLTTWVLTAYTDSCRDHWSATTIGQDKFTRTRQVKESKSRHKERKVREGTKHYKNRKYHNKN